MKILFAGTPANAAKSLELLSQTPFEIVGVLTRPDAPIGRKRVITPSPVAQTASKLGLPTIKAAKVTPEVLSQIESLRPDIGVVVAYGALLSEAALAALPKGWINLHYSLLPDWRGAAPVQHSLLAGDSETGVTLFQIDAGLDTGPIFGTVRTLIGPDETAGELLERLTVLGSTLLSEQLPRIASGIAVPLPQDQTPARLAAKISRDSAQVDWNKPGLEIENQVRALNPEPMAHSVLAGTVIRLLRLRALSAAAIPQDLTLDPSHASSPGTVFGDKKRVFAWCGHDTAVELLQVQPSGKREMSAADWFRGLDNAPKRFETGR